MSFVGRVLLNMIMGAVLGVGWLIMASCVIIAFGAALWYLFLGGMFVLFEVSIWVGLTPPLLILTGWAIAAELDRRNGV